MTNFINIRAISRATLLLMTAVVTPVIALENCPNEQYFSPDDQENARPLARPSRDFREIRQLARKGDATAQRSLAVIYETGYLVTTCKEAARYWYFKAAQGKDPQAVEWMQREQSALAGAEQPSFINWTGHATRTTLARCNSENLPSGQFFQHGSTDRCTSVRDSLHSHRKDATRKTRKWNPHSPYSSHLSTNTAAQFSKDFHTFAGGAADRASDSPPSHRRPHGAPLHRFGEGAIDPVSGDFFQSLGHGYINTRNGTFYPSTGTGGLINPATGEMLPIQ
jgi:hypothetical protein